MIQEALKIKTKEETNEIKECLIPTPGVCWNPSRLMKYNCDECKYFQGCTYVKKGKWKVEKSK